VRLQQRAAVAALVVACTSAIAHASPTRAAFGGLALAIVRGARDRPGRAMLRVEADGLASATLALDLVTPQGDTP
jgi:hypothetical protein